MKEDFKNLYPGEFKYCYDKRNGHFLANWWRYTAKEAAQLAIDNGWRPDVEGLEDIRQSWAAYRFNGNGPSGYTETYEGARGAFKVWAFPVFRAEGY